MTTIASHREVSNLPLLVVSIMLATLMQVIDSTIANVALPDMQGSLSATQDQAAWILTSYIVAAAIATPATGWLAARFGRRHLLVVAIAGFTVASVLCGIATSIGEMVAFRVLQGLFGAALVPISQSSLLDAFPPEKHGAAMALWGMGVMVGPIVGPPLGGWLTENYSWHWVFLINVPIGIIALLGVLASVPKDETRIEPLRLARFRLPRHRHRRAATDARSRQRKGLVLVGRDPDRSRPGLPRLLSLLGALAQSSERTFVNLGSVARSQFRRRHAVHLHRRRAAVCDDGPDAALPAEPHELSGRDHRTAARSARRRHPGRDDHGRAVCSRAASIRASRWRSASC